jgi:hypothetical protein
MTTTIRPIHSHGYTMTDVMTRKQEQRGKTEGPPIACAVRTLRSLAWNVGRVGHARLNDVYHCVYWNIMIGRLDDGRTSNFGLTTTMCFVCHKMATVYECVSSS